MLIVKCDVCKKEVKVNETFYTVRKCKVGDEAIYTTTENPVNLQVCEDCYAEGGN